jgi:malate dehydrogenase (oxaloacetate-decarboxylating)(NADP+)
MCAGSGSAGLGVCGQLYQGMIAAGMTPDDARKRFVVCSKEGAFGKADGKHGNPHYPSMIDEQTQPWVNISVSDGASLMEVMKSFKPTILLGLSAAGPIFTEELIKTMASQVERPVIMPMSNPTSKCECTPEQAYTWTNGKAVVATGSPFTSVTLPDGRTFTPSQCNNMYVFPGLGLAASLAGVTHITDKMLYEAAMAIPRSMTQEEIDEGRTFPSIKRIRDVTVQVACAVIEEAMRAGVATKITKKHLKEGISNFVKRKMYFPHYVPLIGERPK